MTHGHGVLLNINYRKGYCQSLFAPRIGFVKLFQLNAGTCPCKRIKHRHQLQNIFNRLQMQMNIDSYLLYVLNGHSYREL